jgi:hypothetical protein
MKISNHWPCIIEIKTKIPKGKLFRFENFWFEHENFEGRVQQAWSMSVTQQDPARRITTKFINIRKFIKLWRSNLYSLNQVIQKVKLVIYLLETLGLLRDLSLPEWNFGNTLCDKLNVSLKCKKDIGNKEKRLHGLRKEMLGQKSFMPMPH